MNTRVRLTLVAAITGLTAMVPAPQTAKQPATKPAQETSPVTRMKYALRSLVAAEEAHYADRGSYTTDMANLRAAAKQPIATDSVWVTVIFAGGRGWTGTAMFRGVKNVRCVIYVGDPDDLPKLPKTFAQQTPASEGAISCDTP